MLPTVDKDSDQTVGARVRSSKVIGRACVGAAALLLVLVVGFAAIHFGRNDGAGPRSVARSDHLIATSDAKTARNPLVGIPDSEVAIGIDCLALLGDSSNSLTIASNRKRSGIRAFLGSLEQQGITLLGQRLVADLAGLRVVDFDPPTNAVTGSGAIAVVRPPVGAYSLPVAEAQGLPSLAQRDRLRDALRAPKIDWLLDEFRADPALLRAYWPSDDLRDFGAPTTVLGHAVRLRGPELYRALDAMPEELTFGLHELAVAIDQGVDAGDLSAILDRSDIDARSRWRERGTSRHNTLALVAALGANPAALQLLLERGSDPSEGRRSVLDELPLPNEPTDEVREVVRVLLAHGDKPYLPSTRSALKSWLPESAFLPLHPDAEVELATSDMAGLAEELASLVEDWERGVAHATRLEEHCRDSWHGEAILSHTGVSLSAKTRRQDVLDKRHEMTQQAVFRSNQELTRQLEPETARIIDAVYKAVDEGRWEDAMLLADQLARGTVYERVYEHLLGRALYFGAPTDALRALIDRLGGDLPRRAILTLASARNEQALGVAKALRQTNGIELDFVDERGRNAVGVAVANFWETRFNSVVVDENVARWLTFLAENSVSMQPDGGGLDPLDTVLFEVLQRPATNPAGVRVARFLIDHGATVQTSHWELAEEIALADWDGYRHLIQEVPELGQDPESFP